jgi:polysaccharide pyruvyl transferase CsaB
MEANQRELQIGISGSYGGMNLGDEAILEGILSRLRAMWPSARVTVFSRNPADTLGRHQVERAISVRSLTRHETVRAMEGLDVFILGGGGILYDQDAESYVREIFIAHELGVPVMVYAISAGPLTLPSAREAVRAAMDCADVVTVRDRLGYRLLEDLGVSREIHLTADPAFLLEPEPVSKAILRADGVSFDRPLIGLSVREPGPAAPDIEPDQYYALLANTADYVVERYDAEVLFVPMERSDVQHSHAVVSHMQNAERAEILRRTYSPGQILDLVGRLDLAIGMRLHFLIFAALQGTPFTPLPYASKVSGLLADLEMDAAPLGSVGIGQLVARVDRSWDTRAAIRERIRQHIPALRARSLRNNELLAGLVNRRAGQLADGDHPPALH